MARREWAAVKALLADPDFLESCAEDGEDPYDLLQVRSYTRAEKCSQPIHLLRIHPETGECAGVVVSCDSNNAHMCFECSEFKRRLREAQIRGTLDRPGVDVAMLTLTAPSFGAVHRPTWNAKQEYRVRDLDDTARLHARLTHQKMIEKNYPERMCDCKKHHSYDEPLIGTPIGAYDYAGEVLFSAALPRLMNSTSVGLKDRAKAAGIDPKGFRTFSVFERQKRGSLHAHILICVDGNPYGFKRFVEAVETAWTSPSAAVPSDLLDGLETGFQRLTEDVSLLNALPKRKRTLDAVLPKHRGRTAVAWGPIRDIRVLEADDAAGLPDDGDGLGVLEDLVQLAPDSPAELPQHKSHKKAAAYVAKYLTKNNSAFSPEALRELSPEQRAHFSRFRKTAVLLFTDKTVFEAVLRAKRKRIDLTLETAESVEAVEESLARLEADLQNFRDKGVTRTGIADAIVQKLSGQTLTTAVLREFVDAYDASFPSLSTPRADLLAYLPDFPVRYLKTRLNRLASNAGYTGTLASTHNWLHSLKDLKEERKAWFRSLNPDVEVIDYLWEKVEPDSGDAVPAEWSTYRLPGAYAPGVGRYLDNGSPAAFGEVEDTIDWVHRRDHPVEFCDMEHYRSNAGKQTAQGVHAVRYCWEPSGNHKTA